MAQEAKFCSECGQAIPVPTPPFCSQCGTRLASKTDTPSDEAPIPSVPDRLDGTPEHVDSDRKPPWIPNWLPVNSPQGGYCAVIVGVSLILLVVIGLAGIISQDRPASTVEYTNVPVLTSATHTPTSDAKEPLTVISPTTRRCPEGSEAWCSVNESEGQPNKSADIIPTIESDPDPTDIPTPYPATSTPKPIIVEITDSVSRIVHVYQSNEAAGESTYTGKLADITGHVWTVKKKGQYWELELISGLGANLICKMSSEEADVAATLTQGKSVKVRGTILGVPGFSNVVVEPCKVIQQ